MFKGRKADQITLHDLVSAYVERILSLLGHAPAATWEDVR
jgi:hypothetical protein